MVAFKLLKFTFVLAVFSYVAIGGPINHKKAKHNGHTVDKMNEQNWMKTHLTDLSLFPYPEFPGEEALVRQREKDIHRASKIGVMAPQVWASSSEKKKMIKKKKKHPLIKIHDSKKKVSHPENLSKEDIVLDKSKL